MKEGGKMPVQHSIISPNLKIKGDLVSSGDIKVEGSVEGSISCRTLTLGNNPVLNCNVTADTVRVNGEFSGQVKATKVVLTSTARFNGDIYQETLEVEDGASIQGYVGRLKAEAGREPAKISAVPAGQPGAK
ncbi:MAG: polymer-forming cytoskeletal protein [Kiloniellales bacterium]|nr:polymer-forming cytoskeletal protein [Kiloniellales bacterium]